MKIDQYKKKTLDYLAFKAGDPRTYGIGESDLIFVEGCPLCGSESIGKLTEVYIRSELNFCSTGVCNECLYTFRTVSPGLDWFKKCWQAISTGQLEVFNPEMEDYRRQRYEIYCDVLCKYVSGRRVLDIGASYGSGCLVFQNRGFEVDAIESEDDRANYVQEILGVPVCASSIEEFVSQERNYDLVIFAHCLEHLDDPWFVMSRMKNLLRPDTGILYLEVPIVWNVVNWSDALYLAHQSNFSEENVTALALRSGFEVLEKIWCRNSTTGPWNLGIVLRPIDGYRLREGPIREAGGHTVDDVRRLYRSGLPLDRIPPLDRVLRYSVPYIEQFYCTLKFETMRIVEPESESDFISFESLSDG